MKKIFLMLFLLQLAMYSQKIEKDTTITIKNPTGFKMIDIKEVSTFNSEENKQFLYSIILENNTEERRIQLLSIDDKINKNWQNNYSSNKYTFPRKFIAMDSQIHLFVGETNKVNEINSVHNLVNLEINNAGQIVDTIKTKVPIDNFYNTFYHNLVLKHNSNIINIYRNEDNDLVATTYNPQTMEKISNSKIIKKFDPLKKRYDFIQDGLIDSDGSIYFFVTQYYNANYDGKPNSIIYKVNTNFELTHEILVQADSLYYPAKLIKTDNKLVLQTTFAGFHIYDHNYNLIKKVNIKVDDNQYSIVYNDIIYSKKSGFIVTGYDLHMNKKYYFVAKFDEDFNLVWKKELDEGLKTYYFAKLSFINNNTYLFSNVSSDSTIVFKTIIDETVSVDNELRNTNEPQIYPNPAKTNVSIDFVVEPENLPNISVDLYNLTGILQAKLDYNVDYNDANGQGTFNCNIENIPNGYYIIVIDNGKRKIAKPFIVNKE